MRYLHNASTDTARSQNLARRKRGRKKNLDANENEKQVKEEEEGRGDRLFHQVKLSFQDLDGMDRLH